MPSLRIRQRSWQGKSIARLVLLTCALALPQAADAKPAAGPALRVEVDRAKVDLKEHRLEVKMSRPAGKVKIEVFAEDDAPLADEEHDFTGRAAGSPLVVTWKPSSDAPIARIEVRAYDAAGNWSGVQISPWNVAVEHEDVNFKTDSADIEPAEVPKLESAFAKIEEILAKDKAHGRMHPNLALYIAGHTDTVGSGGHNLTLSQARARSIAGWMKKRGVRLPISYEGFGETAPAVKTGDNVDEPRNRRADYIISDGPPRYSTTASASWKRAP